MEVLTRKLDDTLTLQIPASFASELGLEPNSDVDLSIVGSTIFICHTRRPRVLLDDLLEKVTESNLHGEVDTGPDIGQERW